MEIIIQIFISGLILLLCILIRDVQVICWIVGTGMILLVGVSVIAHRIREKRLEDLTMYLMKVQDRLDLPEMKSCGEGNIGILQSEIYKLVALLQEQSSSAVKENTYLSRMLSDISHQIKTPLTSITIMTDLLKSPELPDGKRLEFAARIEQQANRITWLVRNLLTLSQLEADMLKLKKEHVNIKVLLAKAMEPFEIMAEVKEIELTVHVDPDIQIICDEHWTTEAISNIIKNCIEHTPPGGSVTITADQNNFSTNIYIRDTGEGIEKEQLSHIFERFYKGENASENSVGIGLAMSRQLILQQNGMIHVMSEKGKGTAFHIKLYSEINV